MLSTEQVAPNPYEYLGGNERKGSKGGHWNIKLRFPHLLASKCVERWIRKRQPSTIAQYFLNFDKFLHWAKTELQIETPEQFLQWAKSQPDGITVQQIIDDYTATLKPNIGQLTTALLRSFLARNGFTQLPKIPWESTVSFTEGYTRTDIQTLLGLLDSWHEKLYVIVAAESGLRANDLLYLRYKHIKEDFEAGQKFVAIRFEPDRYLRRKAPGRTFIGPYAISILNQLINNGTIKRDPNAKLFPWIYTAITARLARARAKSNLNPEIQTTHGLRKYFIAGLDAARMDTHKKLVIEGHSAGVRSAYTSRDIGSLRTLYAEAYKYLDLREEGAIAGELGELQKQLVAKDAEIQLLKQQIGEIRTNQEKILGTMTADQKQQYLRQQLGQGAKPDQGKSNDS